MTIQLVRQATILRQGLVADPEAKHLKRMRQAVWLYLYLFLAVSPASGKRLLSPRLAARDMGLSEATVRSWLGHLRRQGYVSLDRQGDLVRVTVAKWPKQEPPEEAAPQKPAPRRAPAPRLTAAFLAKSLGCPPDEPYLSEVLSQEDAIRVRAALEKVAEIPESRIRKSRLALFRYLITHPEDS